MRIDAIPIGKNPPEDVNVIVEVPPETTDVGDAVIVTVGAVSSIVTVPVDAADTLPAASTT